MSDPNTPPQPDPTFAPPPPPPPDIPYSSPGLAGADREPLPDARTWGMLCHLSSMAGYVIPFGHIAGPLVVWLIKKDQYPFVDDQGRESLNFQLTMTIVAFVCGILVCAGGIGIPLLIVTGIVDLIFTIIATVKAYEGQPYRYPFNIRMV